MEPEELLFDFLKGSTSQIVSGIVGLIRSAYRRHRRTAGVEKADALLSKIIRGVIQINPDVYDLKSNIIKYRKLVGDEDPKYHIARSIVQKIGVVAAKNARVGRIAKTCRTTHRHPKLGKPVFLIKTTPFGRVVLEPIKKSQKTSVAKKGKHTKRKKK